MLRAVCLVLVALALAGCPDPPEKTEAKSPSEQTSDPKTKTNKTEPKTQEGPEPVKTGGIGIQANAKDPVCGKEVGIGTPGASHRWGNELYLFCSEGCKEKFVASPKSHIRRE